MALSKRLNRSKHNSGNCSYCKINLKKMRVISRSNLDIGDGIWTITKNTTSFDAGNLSDSVACGDLPEEDGGVVGNSRYFRRSASPELQASPFVPQQGRIHAPTPPRPPHRRYLLDLRSAAGRIWTSERVAAITEQLLGLHMPLLCPDDAVVAYTWKRQLAGQAGVSAVDRTRLALKAFTDQKRHDQCFRLPPVCRPYWQFTTSKALSNLNVSGAYHVGCFSEEL
ncbi:uncharacterized protein LOC103963056 [Pyrus x bretschneideri]|uniref:uncharacterized protein LOC103963056 n=1 Tax=Pyrus x bretschneideri TaxID=225117 RepID=UPI00202FBAC8|nr:uncharacterized protein LOC103963056 [Pyrus x bretschneideri]